MEKFQSLLKQKNLQSEFICTLYEILEIEGLRSAQVLDEIFLINVEERISSIFLNKKSKFVCRLYEILEIESLRSTLVPHNISGE